MDQVSSILHLGGYGAYVWPAYGVAAVVLIGLLWRTLASLRANERQAAQLQIRTVPSDGFAANAQAGGASRGGALS